MKRLGLGLLAALSACGGASGYSSTYTGTITETYSCSASSPPAFQLPADTFQLDVDGQGNATVTIASCPGDTLYGVQNGNEINIQQSSTFSCNQIDSAGDTIAITSIGGSLTFDNGSLDVSLTETATIDSDSCGGSAVGQLN